MRFSTVMLVSWLVSVGALPAVDERRGVDSTSTSFFEKVVGSTTVLKGKVEKVEEVDGGRRIHLVDSEVTVRIPAAVFVLSPNAWDMTDDLVGKDLWAHGRVVQEEGELMLDVLVPAELATSAADLDEKKFPKREYRRFQDAGKIGVFFFDRPARLLVHGVVKRVIPGDADNLHLIQLEGTETVVVVADGSLAANANWKLEDYVGKKIYLAALTQRKDGKRQLLVEKPSQIDTDAKNVRIADAPKFDPKSAPPKVKERKSGTPVDTNAIVVPYLPAKVLPLVKEEAACTVLLRIKLPIKGGRSQGEIAQIARFTVSTRKVPGMGAMQIMTLNCKANQSDVIRELMELASRLGGWPDDVLVTIKGPRADAQVEPLVASLLIESLISGAKIHPNVMVADFERKSRFSVGAPPLTKRALLDAVVGKHGNPVRLLVQNYSAAEVADLALEKKWSLLSQVQFLGFSGAGEAAALAFATPDSQVGRTLTGIDQTNKILKQRGAAILKNPHVVKRIAAAEALSVGENLSAAAYRTIADGKLGERFSAAHSGALLLDIATLMLEHNPGETGKRKLIVDSSKAVDALKKTIDPSLENARTLLVDALDEYEKAAKANTREAFILYLNTLDLVLADLNTLTGSDLTTPFVKGRK